MSDTFALRRYKAGSERVEKKKQRLRELDLFVLDNSLRETTVGALRGHTLENKFAIYKQVWNLRSEFTTTEKKMKLI